MPAQSAKELAADPYDVVRNFTIQEVSLFSHLVEILCFFIRQHLFRSKYFILAEGLASRIAQLLSCSEKHLKLSGSFSSCLALSSIPSFRGNSGSDHAQLLSSSSAPACPSKIRSTTIN